MALSVEDIRLYAKDDPELNILLEGQLQSSDGLVDLAMRMATSDFNAIAPITGYTVNTFPDSSALLYGTLHHLCNSEAERQLRNNVTYSAQGLNAGIDDKFEQYNRLALYYKQMFDQKAQAYKMYANAQEAWGDSYSPYAIINQYLFRQ